MSDNEEFWSSTPRPLPLPTQMSPPPAAPVPGPTSTPPGYVGYGEPEQLAEPSGLRKAALALFCVATAAGLLTALMAYRRGDVAEDVFNGSRPVGDLESSDSQVASIALLAIVAQTAAAVVVAVWSHRTVTNAKRRAPAASLRPGLAAGGWFIPFGWWWVPWRELKRSVEATSFRPPASLRQWQMLFVAQGAVSYLTRNLGDFTGLIDRTAMVTRAHTQGVVMAGVAVVMALTTWRASIAMRAIDAANASGKVAAL
jgi:hypothetical protein